MIETEFDYNARPRRITIILSSGDVSEQTIIACGTEESIARDAGIIGFRQIVVAIENQNGSRNVVRVGVAVDVSIRRMEIIAGHRNECARLTIKGKAVSASRSDINGAIRNAHRVR